MLAFDIKSYIAKNVAPKHQAEFEAVPETLLDNGVLATAKLVSEEVKVIDGIPQYPESFYQKAGAIRTDIQQKLANGPAAGKITHTTIMGLYIVAYAQKLMEECLGQPETAVHKQFLELVGKYKPPAPSPSGLILS